MLRRPCFVFAFVVVLAPVLGTCAHVQVPYTDGLSLIPTDTGTTFQGVHVPVVCPAGTHGGGVHPHAAEFDDCQRLTLGASQFSALIGVRALSRTTSGDLSPFDQPFGTAVAQLYNFSSFVFGPMRIQPKYSCVYLRRQGGNWRGRIVPVDEMTTCPAPSSSTWAADTLSAVREAIASNNPSDYPAVARWEWTPAAGNGAIGVHCGAGWCEIGPAAGHAPTPGVPKGWSDEQLLAVKTPGGLIPRVHARIIPERGLDTLQLHHLTCDSPCADPLAAWVHVATVTLLTPSDYYRDKLNFETGRAGNRIYIRYKPVHPQHQWQTMIVSASGRRSFHVTEYAYRPGEQIPPIARFRWRPDDDTTWVRCPLGCCESVEAKITAV